MSDEGSAAAAADSTPVVRQVAVRGVEMVKQPKPHVVYKIEVFTQANHWTVSRRYTEFHQLYTELAQSITFPANIFPPKRVIKSMAPEFIELRRVALQEFLHEVVLGKYKQAASKSKALQAFLELDSQLNHCSISNVEGIGAIHLQLTELRAHNCIRQLQDVLVEAVVQHAPEDAQLEYHILPWAQIVTADFSNNGLPMIDESVMLLPNVVKLDLSYNALETVDHLQRLERLYSLQHLDLSHNLIADVHETTRLGSMPCLESLKLIGNPMVGASAIAINSVAASGGEGISTSTKKWSHSKYRIYVLSRFGDRFREVVLDDVIATPAEQKKVQKLLAKQHAERAVAAVGASTDQSDSPARQRSSSEMAGSRPARLSVGRVLFEAPAPTRDLSRSPPARDIDPRISLSSIEDELLAFSVTDAAKKNASGKGKRPRSVKIGETVTARKSTPFAGDVPDRSADITASFIPKAHAAPVSSMSADFRKQVENVSKEGGTAMSEFLTDLLGVDEKPPSPNSSSPTMYPVRTDNAQFVSQLTAAPSAAQPQQDVLTLDYLARIKGFVDDDKAKKPKKDKPRKIGSPAKRKSGDVSQLIANTTTSQSPVAAASPAAPLLLLPKLIRDVKASHSASSSPPSTTLMVSVIERTLQDGDTASSSTPPPAPVSCVLSIDVAKRNMLEIDMSTARPRAKRDLNCLISMATGDESAERPTITLTIRIPGDDSSASSGALEVTYSLDSLQQVAELYVLLEPFIVQKPDASLKADAADSLANNVQSETTSATGNGASAVIPSEAGPATTTSTSNSDSPIPPPEKTIEEQQAALAEAQIATHAAHLARLQPVVIKFLRKAGAFAETDKLVHLLETRYVQYGGWGGSYLLSVGESSSAFAEHRVLLALTSSALFALEEASTTSVHAAEGGAQAMGLPAPPANIHLGSYAPFRTSTRLTVAAAFPLQSVRAVLVGLFDQMFRVEFSQRESFVFLTRDFSLTHQFLNSLASAIKERQRALIEQKQQQAAKTSVNAAKEDPSLAAYSYTSIYNQKTADELEREQGGDNIYRQAIDDSDTEFVYPDTTALDTLRFRLCEQNMDLELPDEFNPINYTMAYQVIPAHSANEEAILLPRTLVLSNRCAYLVQEDYGRWPLPSFVTLVPDSPQYMVLSVHPIGAAVAIELSQSDPRHVAICFDPSIRLRWNSSLSSSQSLPARFSMGPVRDSADILPVGGGETWTLRLCTMAERDNFIKVFRRLWADTFQEELIVTWAK
ncbi:hypothetical protein CAOG_08695 [Capsaspora owczarzaki ATCC 30864]|uniref:hypothetical protein n=1 Tax=Capsaspora owczarzaki (strain ATCC 30864) TaxID=595528 RepID=UPI0003520CC5|nr:hypothetical protein CAOG_08695 [Capsaspora owczarzaki ATCC 30864]|eukprot:XP_011270306.1 hypothetical protein CAOG_08695 [Capsaspora owczarzaki ATCC 30864]